MVRHYAAVAGGRHVPHVSAGLAHVADSDDEATALIRARLPSSLGPGLVGYRRADTDSLTAPATPTTTPNCGAASIPSAHIPSAQPSGAATGWPAPPATGIRNMIFMVEGCGDQDRTLENIRRLGAEVLPHLRSRGPFR